MARKTEERKRGKKRRKVNADKEGEEGTIATPQEGFFIDRTGDEQKPGEEEQPSWLIEKEVRPSSSQLYTDTSTPFGLVDADLKAYLRTAHIKLQELVEAAVEEGRSATQDEEIKTLRNAMLDEVKGKELTLATDADTSRILEDMFHTFSERQVRILADSLTSSNDDLHKICCHRFGSHLLQTTILGLQVAISPQGITENGKGAKPRGRVFDAQGKELRSAEQLIVDVSDTLSVHATDLLSNQFGTHVLRTLLLILAGRAGDASELSTRSKRSRSFREKTQGVKIPRQGDTMRGNIVPSLFHQSLQALLAATASGLEKDKVRKLSMDPVASPTLTLVLELFPMNTGEDSADGTLLDIVLDGLVSKDSPERSNFVEELIRDNVGSHMLQKLAEMLKKETVAQFWTVYIQGRLCKLGTHPIANFVIAAFVRRLEDEGGAFVQACQEIELAGDSLVKNQRLGILIALSDRARELYQMKPVDKVAPNATRKRTNVLKDVWTDSAPQSRTTRAILSAFGFGKQSSEKEEEEGHEKDDRLDLSVLVAGKTRKDFKKEEKRAKKASKGKKRTADEAVKEEEGRQLNGDTNDMQVSIQGSLLCQSLLRLCEPGNTPLLNALLLLPSLLPLGSNATTVHILLSPLQSNAGTSILQRKAFAEKIMVELAPLMNDKFGSRVIDCLFDTSDAYFKEKVMNRCIDRETNILTSNYGRYFLKRSNMSLFRKNVSQWKQWIKEKDVQKQQANDQSRISSTNGSQFKSAVKVEANRPRKGKVDEELDTILAGL